MPNNLFGPGQAGFALPQYMKLFGDLLGQQEESDPYADLLGQIHGQFTEAQKAAAAGQAELTGAQNTPAQTVGPGQAGLATLLGGVSSVLAPNLRGNEMAQTGIAQKNQDFKTEREDRLKRMESHYETLAQRAEKLGNTELSLKMSAKAESIKSKQEKLRETAQMAGSAAAGDAQRYTTLEAERLRNQGDLAELDKRLALQGLNKDGSPKLAGAPVGVWTEAAAGKRKVFESIKDTDQKGRRAAHADMLVHELTVRADELATPAKFVQRAARFRPFKIGKKFENIATPYLVAKQVFASWPQFKHGTDDGAAEVLDLLLPAYTDRINPLTGRRYTTQELSQAADQAATLDNGSEE